MARCRECGAEIMFIRSQSGKQIPVNPHPVYVEDSQGDHIIVTTDGRVVNGREQIVTSRNCQLTRGYISHFATCPYASAFRRR